MKLIKKAKKEEMVIKVDDFVEVAQAHFDGRVHTHKWIEGVVTRINPKTFDMKDALGNIWRVDPREDRIRYLQWRA